MGRRSKGNGQDVQEGGRVLAQEGRRQSRKLEKALANFPRDLQLQQKRLYFTYGGGLCPFFSLRKWRITELRRQVPNHRALCPLHQQQSTHSLQSPLKKSSLEKTCALNPVKSRLIQQKADTVAPFITLLFNRSLADGVFPDSFKGTITTMLLKRSDLIRRIQRISDRHQTFRTCRRSW